MSASAPRTHVRDLPDLWPLRQRRNAVIVCRDDPEPYSAARDSFEALDAALLVETRPGRLSAALGRPSVTVADRYGSIGLHEQRPPIGRVLAQLEAFELECPECGPQAWGDPGDMGERPI